MDYDIITDAINKAVKQADENGIKEKIQLRFCWQKVKEITGGDSLESNIMLVSTMLHLGQK